VSSPVLELAQRYVPRLKPGAGDNWTGFCPIHGEVPGKSKPSFSFNAATGQWYCFSGCGGGHIQSFLKHMGKNRESIDITMQRLEPHLKKVAKKKLKLSKKGIFETDYPLPERILGLFEACPEGLIEDGFEEEILWEHDVGYDEERGRVTYPVRDLEGTLAGIVGRTNNPSMKYKVYVKELQDMGFSKYSFENHDYLWRGDIVYAQCYHAGKRPTTYLVEGFKACLWMVQCGYENTWATMGTLLTDQQRMLLERLGGTLIWCSDNDYAGQKMVLKNSKKVQGLRQFVMNYPDPYIRAQPDDLSPDEVHAAVNKSLNIGRWRRRIKKSHG